MSYAHRRSVFSSLIRHGASLLAPLAAAGCGAGVTQPEAGGTAGVQTTAPLLEGSSDAADTSCNVVLRTAGRVADATGGYEVDATTGQVVFTGVVDLAEAATASATSVGVAYSSGGAWYDVTASASAGAPAGFRRYAFRIDRDTAAAGASTTSLSGLSLQLAPYARGAAGGRLFDHNRNPAPFANYVLDAADAWSITDAPAVCDGAAARPSATLEFQSGLTTAQHGALVAGGALHVLYALDRLPQCRGTHDGFPAWSTTAFVRFLPGGQLASAPVQAFVTNNGTPTDQAYSVPLDADVPVDATSAELWFHNQGGAGDVCDGWDSQYGANYRFEVRASAPAAPAWAGRWGGSFARDCGRTDGLAEPTVVDEYVRERACMFVEADVYVPGVSDVGEHPELVEAEVEWSVDGGAPQRAWLSYQGRVGNDYRFRWSLPRDVMSRDYWNRYSYTFRFSTDGASWFSIGQGDGPTGGAPRTIARDASWCMPGWPGCG